jgi:tRNA pseudouridine38-40 synthase
VTKAKWIQTKKLLIFHITADRFLRNMVRAVVGTLIDVGEGKTTLEEFKQIIESENRCNAGPSAPPQGLFLTEVTYPKNIFVHE